jgi:hypothetical protein
MVPGVGHIRRHFYIQRVEFATQEQVFTLALRLAGIKWEECIVRV